jgi:hypothetical protein
MYSEKVDYSALRLLTGLARAVFIVLLCWMAVSSGKAQTCNPTIQMAWATAHRTFGRRFFVNRFSE